MGEDDTPTPDSSMLQQIRQKRGSRACSVAGCYPACHKLSSLQAHRESSSITYDRTVSSPDEEDYQCECNMTQS